MGWTYILEGAMWLCQGLLYVCTQFQCHKHSHTVMQGLTTASVRYRVLASFPALVPVLVLVLVVALNLLLLLVLVLVSVLVPILVLVHGSCLLPLCLAELYAA